VDIAGNFIGAQQRGINCILKMFAVSPWKICPRRKLNSAKLESRDYRVLHTVQLASSRRRSECRDACSRRVPTGIGYERRRPKLRYFHPIAIYMRQDIESPSICVVVSHARLFILPKGKKSLGTCLFRFGSRNLELYCVT